MILNHIRKYINRTLIAAAIAAALPACSDDLPSLPDYTRSGDDVEVKVSLIMPEMTVKSRADLGTDQLNQVSSLWVRTYSAENGQATSDWVEVENLPTTDTEVAREVTIRSKSGSSYIVGVANVDNMGVLRSNPETRSPLRQLLMSADTWQQFLDIAVVAPVTQQYVLAPSTPLPMAGCFSTLVVGGTHPEPRRIDEWQDKDFQPYFIPAQAGVVDLKSAGAIHLRRLVAHVNFNIIPAEDLYVTVNTYQVMNAPRFSWLYERRGNGANLQSNFGDLATTYEQASTYYANVPQFGAQFITENADGSSSFDFWQAENKHIGTSTSYAERGAYTGTDPVLYTSLTGDTWTSNNMASYVLVSCSVEYKQNLNVNDQGIVTPGGTSVNRTGEVTYIIHLGGLDGDATDFNCYRNVNYTYNVTVNGVDDIRVDAYSNPEIYHNEEGMVVDLSSATIDIDGHYGVFNVQLTQAELSAENFGFIIIAYDNGRQYTVTDANQRQNRTEGGQQVYDILDENGAVIDPKYYNWIEMRPTTGQNVLAQYRPRYGGNADGATFLLSDLVRGENTSAWANMSTNTRSTSGWYTVFVNEYTYEPMYTGDESYANEEWNGVGRPNWMSYVNQAPRRFYIRVTQQVSPDGKSVYARSKYGISQQSLQSFYSDQEFVPAEGNVPAGAAIAVERVNETEGFNMRQGTFTGGSSRDNGRWNLAQHLYGTDVNIGTVTSRPLWGNYIEVATPMQRGAVTGLRAQGGPELPARTIANGNPIKLNALPLFTQGESYCDLDPQGNNNYVIEISNTCMSRNRDNNGNGRIDPEELRWYIPAINKLFAMMLGQSSLPEPLMNYARVRLPYVDNKQFNNTSGSIVNDYYTRYMYIGSNSTGSDGTYRNVLWAMEGTSTSNLGNIPSWNGVTGATPWQVRCVRNLGSNLNTITEDDKVSQPFVHDAAAHTFHMTYYDMASVRTIKVSGNGAAGEANVMPVHTISTLYNKPYRAFEYSENEYSFPTAYRPNTTSEDLMKNTYSNIADYIATNPCGSQTSLTGSGWRLPNQVELTIMRNQGLITGNSNSSNTWLSCTVNNFSFVNGQGSQTDINNRYYLIVLPGQGSQLTYNNYKQGNYTLRYRCVRDID